MGTEGLHNWNHPVPPKAVEKAVRLAYVQAMLYAIFISVTGGMFITGYAIELGATNVQIGLLSTVPMLGVTMQFISAVLVERGVSRRSMTMLGSALNPGAWVIVAILPYALSGASVDTKIAALIAALTFSSLFGHLSANARASWIGDLIPPRRLGMFFGRLTMYGGIVGVILAVIAGRLLDRVKEIGLPAFSGIFLFGVVSGLVCAALYVPQSDVPVEKHKSGSALRLIGETFRNRALLPVMAYATFWSMQLIAAPFYPTYLLRDLKMPFLGVSIVSAVPTVTMLISSPFWGRVVDRYGCRPVLVACTFGLAPISLVWILLGDAKLVYYALPAANILAGFAVGGVTVALNTLLYKVTPNTGRPMQIAIYSIVVTLFVAPLPAIGGHLPDWLRSLGLHADLRSTFYASGAFCMMAAFMARKIKEPDSRQTSEMVANLPTHVRSPRTLKG